MGIFKNSVNKSKVQKEDLSEIFEFSDKKALTAVQNNSQSFQNVHLSGKKRFQKWTCSCYVNFAEIRIR